MMNILQVDELIKQRPPFQFIDKILEYEANDYAVGIKNVSVNEPYFNGHFPGSPIMPGVLIMECCAQLAGAVYQTESEYQVLLKVDNFRFNKAIIPGDTLKITVKKVREGGILAVFDCKVEVENEVYAKGTMTFTVTSKDKIYNRE